MNRAEKLREAYFNMENKAEKSKLRDEIFSLTKENPDEYSELYLEVSKDYLTHLQEINVKAKLAQVENIISLSYIAEKYFNKSKSWLSQRINGHVVNGKPAQLSEDEIKTLNFAINDIGKQLGTFSF